MKFYGTRDKERVLYSLGEAAMMGLAPCGGLFMPERISQVDMDRVLELAEISFGEMATYIAHTIFANSMSEKVLRDIIESAFNFDIPLKNIGEDLYTLELFHGPTLAFKDVGARFMGHMFSYLRGDKELTILTATSGDTGSAVADGFYGIEGIRVVVLYPKGRVSDFQERQMTTLGGNIKAISVDGTFDDCQAMVKSIFTDHAFCRENRITSANSINIIRWIPQSFYYFWGYAAWRKATGGTHPTIVVPSGNYGNIAAGMLASLMGMPVERFVAATNENRSIPNFLDSGIYSPLDTVETISNAMDVGNPSNYERIWELYGRDIERLRAALSCFSYSDEQTVDAIKKLYSEYGYISDPHSAVAYQAFKESEAKGFWISTAHSSKFDDVIKDMAHIDVDTMPERMSYLFEKQKSFTSMSADSDKLKQFILSL